MRVFISYGREKDEFNAVSEFRRHFENELRQLVPGSAVFQDTEGIRPGDRFSERLANEIATADVLLVLVSPAWLTREWCRREFELFSARERERGGPARVLPVLWVRTEALSSPGDDPIARALAELQCDDWQDLRHEDWRNPAVRRRVARLADRARQISMERAAMPGTAEAPSPSRPRDASIPADLSGSAPVLEVPPARRSLPAEAGCPNPTEQVTERLDAMRRSAARLSFSADRDAALVRLIDVGLAAARPDLVIGDVARLSFSQDRDAQYKRIVEQLTSSGQYTLAGTVADRLSFSADRDQAHRRIIEAAGGR